MKIREVNLRMWKLKVISDWTENSMREFYSWIVMNDVNFINVKKWFFINFYSPTGPSPTALLRALTVYRRANITISTTASSAEYQMDKQFRNFSIFGILIVF